MSYTPTFSYNGGSNPPIDYPRLMISDTVESVVVNGVTVQAYVFSDQEITAITTMLAGIFQSAQFYSPPAGATLPSSPVSYFRIAASLIDCIVANKAKLASIRRILDVELDPSKAAQWLRDQAKAYREMDDDSGAFFIIEQVNNQWSLQQRYNNQIQRQQGVGW